MLSIEPGSPAETKTALETIAFLQSSDARVIGFIADGFGTGVRRVASAVARAYVGFGRSTLLVDAEVAPRAPSSRDAGEAPPHLDIRAHVEERDGLLLASIPSAVAARTFLAAAKRQVDRVVVALPPVPPPSAGGVADDLAVGAACDAVLYICASDATDQTELEGSLRMLRIAEVPVAGLILDDRQLPFARYLR